MQLHRAESLSARPESLRAASPASGGPLRAYRWFSASLPDLCRPEPLTLAIFVPVVGLDDDDEMAAAK